MVKISDKMTRETDSDEIKILSHNFNTPLDNVEKVSFYAFSIQPFLSGFVEMYFFDIVLRMNFFHFLPSPLDPRYFEKRCGLKVSGGKSMTMMSQTEKHWSQSFRLRSYDNTINDKKNLLFSVKRNVNALTKWWSDTNYRSSDLWNT